MHVKRLGTFIILFRVSIFWLIYLYRYFMLVVALHAQSHSQSYTVAAHVSERIIVRVTSGHVCFLLTAIISHMNVKPFLLICCSVLSNLLLYIPLTCVNVTFTFWKTYFPGAKTRKECIKLLSCKKTIWLSFILWGNCVAAGPGCVQIQRLPNLKATLKGWHRHSKRLSKFESSPNRNPQIHTI